MTMTEARGTIPDPAAQPFMSVGEVARACQSSEEAVYRAVQRGDIPHIRLGLRKGIRIPTAAVRRLAALGD